MCLSIGFERVGGKARVVGQGGSSAGHPWDQTCSESRVCWGFLCATHFYVALNQVVEWVWGRVEWVWGPLVEWVGSHRKVLEE